MPYIVSAPASPVFVSSPPKPNITLSSALPVSRSAPELPMMLPERASAGNRGKPGTGSGPGSTTSGSGATNLLPYSPDLMSAPAIRPINGSPGSTHCPAQSS